MLALIEQQIAAGLQRGMQVYVSRGGEVRMDTGIGRRTQDDEAITTRTRFAVYSCTKPITATALHLLVERGAVSYDDPVVRYLPEFGRHGKDEVTLRHVLLHQSGFADWARRVPAQAFADFPDAIDRICSLEPEHPPGEATIYHELTGVAVVAEVVQRLTDTPFAAFCADEVFAPLGMTDTSFGLTDDLLAEATLTTGATPQRQEANEAYADARARASLLPGVGVWATARDLGRFYEVWLDAGRYAGGQILRPETAAEATSLLAPVSPSFGFGLGFMVGVDPDVAPSRGSRCSVRTFGHPGMCSAQALADPSTGLVVVLLANGDPGQEAGDRRFGALCDAVVDID